MDSNWIDETSDPHSGGDDCPTCKDTFQNGKCAFVQVVHVVDKRAMAREDAPLVPVNEAPDEMVLRFGEPTAERGRFECPGCKKVHTYPLPLDPIAARKIVLQHQRCKQGKRRGAKQRLTVGRFGKPGR